MKIVIDLSKPIAFFKRIKTQFINFLVKLKAKKKTIFEKEITNTHHADFEKMFNVNPKHILEIISKLEKNDISDDKMEKIKEEERLKNISIINTTKKTSPFNYDPEVIDIHNESLQYKSGLTIEELRAIDTKSSRNIIAKQERVLDVKEHLKKKKLKPKRPHLLDFNYQYIEE